MKSKSAHDRLSVLLPCGWGAVVMRRKLSCSVRESKVHEVTVGQ
jgi:hypothetical protein